MIGNEGMIGKERGRIDGREERGRGLEGKRR